MNSARPNPAVTGGKKMAIGRVTGIHGLTRRAIILSAPVLFLPRTAAAAIAPTPRSSEGPFYPVRLPRDHDADLVRVEGAVREAGGEILHLAGRVLTANAKPIAGARIEIWQCDVNGIYLHPGDRRRSSRDSGFQGFGRTTADAEGHFAFRTIVPVPYPGRTPHIHVKVLDGGRELLTSQLYRAGHPGNAADFLFNRLTADEQQRVSMAVRPVDNARRPSFATDIDLVIGG